MRAIRKRESAPGLTLEEVPVPTPAPDEVLVRIEASTICGTDLHIQRWDQWSSERVTPPLTLGHELCGTVVATGNAVRDVAEGDYVSAESHVTCGVCFHCRTGKAHMCEQTRILGVDRDGGFADYVRCLRASSGATTDQASARIACLQEPFGNAVFNVDARSPGRAVAVLGCGPVGLFAIAWRRPSAPAGSSRPMRSFRIELAQKLGADDVVNVDEVDDVPHGSSSATRERRRRRIEMSGALRDRGRLRSSGTAGIRPLRDPGRPGQSTSPSRHLQEPDGDRGERTGDLGDVVHDALASRRHRRSSPAHHRRASARALRGGVALVSRAKPARSSRPNGATP